MKPFPFLVGCDRSGTTLIQAVFNAHPEMTVPHESQFMVPLLRRRKHYEREGGFDVDGFVTDLFARPFLEGWELTEEDIRDALKRARPTSTPDAIRAVYQLYARGKDKTRYGDKTPGYVLRIPLLAESFPEGRFVHIVRDGRDVALSLGEAEWGPRSSVELARFWKQRVDAGRRAGRALGPQRYDELRYEDFVADPEGEMKRICAFLDLPYEESMLDYSKEAGSILKQSPVPHRHRGLFDKPAERRRQWRTEMDGRNVALFEAIAGSSLSDFGYERGVPQIPLSIRATARTGQLVRKLKGIPDRIRWHVRPHLKRLPKA